MKWIKGTFSQAEILLFDTDDAIRLGYLIAFVLAISNTFNKATQTSLHANNKFRQTINETNIPIKV